MDVKLQNFLRMSQFESLSVAGRNIIENYLNGIKSIFSNNKDRLAVSLYAQLPDAKSEVLNILKSYTINFEKCFSKDELAILQEECKAAIRYCYSRKDPDLGMIRPSADHPMQIPESVLSCAIVFWKLRREVIYFSHILHQPNLLCKIQIVITTDLN